MSQKRCAYIYATGDKLVLSGKYKVGEQCVAQCRNVELTQGFCYGHFKKWNKENNPDVNAKAGRKQSDSLRASAQKARDRNREIVDNLNDNLTDIDQEVLQVLGKNEKCDLIYEYSILKRLNPNPQSESYAEKFAFAIWLNTPESKRTPTTIEEVPEILGVSIYSLNSWRRSPELVRIFNNKAKQSFVGSLPWIHDKLLKRVAGGSEKAMDVSIKIIKEYETEMGAKTKTAQVGQKLLDEAKTINETSGTDRFVGVANQVKKVAAYDMLVNGNVKPNDLAN
jgi:hypothetical protein